MTAEILQGGVANPGRVVRVGDTVRRPPSAHRSSIVPLLEHIHATGLIEVPVPLGLDDQGREVFSFIDGDVPIPPYPEWAVTSSALASVGRLLRRYHDAGSSFDPRGLRWSNNLCDPAGGDLVCHNDVCLENVVFRNGEAIGLLDFDFAAPGRRAFDVGMTLRMWGQVRHPDSIPEAFGRPDPIDRVAVFCDAYGMAEEEGDELVEGLLSAYQAGEGFVRKRAEAGEPWFAEVWQAHGREKFVRDQGWVEEHRSEILSALRSSQETRS